MFLIRRNIIKSFLKKEFVQMMRDKRMRFIIFAPPIIMLLLFGYAVNTDVKDISIAVYDESRSQQSRTLVEKFTGSGYFNINSYLHSEKQAAALLDSGSVELYFHIKKDFSKRIKNGKKNEVQVIVDGTDANRASVIISYVNEITNKYAFDFFQKKMVSLIIARNLKGIKLKNNIILKERFLFNPELKSRNFYMPAILGLIIALTGIMLTSMSIVREREIGTIEQIIVSPIRSLEYITGKALPFIIVSFLDIIMASLIVIFWFNVPFNGTIIFLLLMSFVFIFTNIAIGLLISTLSHSQQQTILTTFLYLLPSIMLSGFVFPIDSMPGPIQVFAKINPMSYFIVMIRGIFLKGTGLAVHWRQLLELFLIGVLLFSICIKRFKEQ